MLPLLTNFVTGIERRFHPGNADGGGRRRAAPYFTSAKPGKTLVPKRVLVIEDNLDSVHALAYLLSDMGHAVEYAINGYVALDVARRFRPDVALLDLGLPGMDGFEVCRQIRRDPQLRFCRVVAVTAYSGDEHRVRAKELGFERYLVKPVDTRVLENLLG